MEHPLIDYLLNLNIITLNQEEKQAIVDSIAVESFPKGSILLKEGQVAQDAFFIVKGCVRQYYLKKDGEERTTAFFTEEQGIAPLESINKQLPSKFYLSCVEDSTLAILNSKKEIALYERFPKFESLARLMLEEELQQTQEYLNNYIISSPEERYLELLENRPELLHRVPQYQLASYLGIKPESLSRIRKRVLSKK